MWPLPVNDNSLAVPELKQINPLSELSFELTAGFSVGKAVFSRVGAKELELGFSMLRRGLIRSTYTYKAQSPQRRALRGLLH